MLAGFLIVAATIGFIADVLSLWPRVQRLLQTNRTRDIASMFLPSGPITLDISRLTFKDNLGLGPVALLKKMTSTCTKSKNETVKPDFMHYGGYDVLFAPHHG